MSVYSCIHVCRYPRKSEVADSTRADVPGSCKLPEVGLRETNLDHLEDQYVFFTPEATSPLLFLVCIYGYVCMYVSICHTYAVAWDGQKRASDPWELE